MIRLNKKYLSERNCLPIYFSYGYDIGLLTTKWRLKGPELNYLWKCFTDTTYSHTDYERYQIIKGNGGFDVIIGNPPYVVYTNKDSSYQIGNEYKTKECSNLYAFCVERCQLFISSYGRFGMIVPNSSISANKMLPLQRIIIEGKRTWISNYSWRRWNFT